MAANSKQASNDSSFKIVTGGLVAAIVLFAGITIVRGCAEKSADAKQQSEAAKRNVVAAKVLDGERAKIDKYAAIDKAKGTYKIPVAQAMKLVVKDARNYDGRKLVPAVEGDHNVATMDATFGPYVAPAAPTGPAPTTPLALGKQLYAAKACIGCHSLTGVKTVGPSFKGIFGKEEEMADGSKITVDAAYIKESLLEPNAKIVKGFAPAMPPYKGQLDDAQIAALVEFIKAQK